ncbi:nucleoside hydrolase [Streptomyces sp. NPDC020951]|uniref:nucleoside hydrolase n=1 Tax=Streptomyces sp. NPDC020951 TaxID=3365104 RepID=UPI0037BAEC28
MEIGRRGLMRGVGATLATGATVGVSAGSASAQTPATGKAKPHRAGLGARSRVIISNDLAGDPDGLFSTVHALLSPSTEVRGIIGTFADGRAPYDPANGGDGSAQAAELGRTIVRLMGLQRTVPVFKGADSKLTDPTRPVRSPGAEAIVAEAMRTDTALPLYVTVGAALTEVASALLIEPAVADRMTVIWIGGGPYPSGSTGETNFNEDPIAAQVVFNNSSVPLWQVPSDAYGVCMVSDAELEVDVAPYGDIGPWLYAKLQTARETLWANGRGVNTGETWSLGDSPLVLLTALTSWGPSTNRPFLYQRTGSSPYDTVYAPFINSDGTYTARSEGRKIRVYKDVDTRTLFSDFFAKMRAHHARGSH